MAARRRGFTLVELLVVMSIIAALMGLLLPAVQAARETARRNTCLNDTRQMAMATLQYEEQKGAYPGYLNTVKNTLQPDVSYVVMLMPFLERSDLFKIWNDASNAASGGLANAAPYMAILVCPSNPASATSGNPVSYVVNAGMADFPTSGTGSAQPQYAVLKSAAGVFTNRSTTTANAPKDSSGNVVQVKTNSGYISANDGLGMTLMISENLPAGISWNPASISDTVALYNTAFMWYHTAPSTGAANYQINSNKNATPSVPTDLSWVRPSSAHTGGVNVAFCDAHAKFIVEDIAYGVYKQLMSPNGSQVNQMITDADQTVPPDESTY